MTNRTAEVIVLGGGAMGSATGWALARQGVDVVVLERFAHVHDFGSHGGRTRIFRHAYAEGARYVPWALEADALWTAMQERTPERFLFRVGCIDVSAPGFPRAREARASADAFGVRNEWLTGAEVNTRWPAWNLPADREVCFGPEAGFLDVPIALRAFRRELEDDGGRLVDRTPVTGWSANGNGVTVSTADGDWHGDRLVLTAGPWSIDLLRNLDIPLEVRRKPVLWFATDDDAAFAPDRFPAFIFDDEHGEFYGIPQHGEPGIKVGMHSGGEVVHPDAVDRTVSAKDADAGVGPFVQRSFHGSTGSVLASVVCMYTMTPDEDFVIDQHPEHERVVLATGFSGHGFKFAPVVGEFLASLATDPSVEARPDFGLARFRR